MLGPVGGMESPSEVAAVDTSEEAVSEEETEEEGEEESSDTAVDAGRGLINTGPMSVDQPVDEGVTSGSDGVTGDPGGSN